MLNRTRDELHKQRGGLSKDAGRNVDEDAALFGLWTFRGGREVLAVNLSEREFFDL